MLLIGSVKLFTNQKASYENSWHGETMAEIGPDLPPDFQIEASSDSELDKDSDFGEFDLFTSVSTAMQFLLYI